MKREQRRRALTNKTILAVLIIFFCSAAYAFGDSHYYIIKSAGSGTSDNPFDQSLNTTDDVQFNSVHMGNANQYWQTGLWDLGPYGAYPMLTSYSDGILGNMGAIKNNLLLVGSSNPTLYFVDENTLASKNIQYSVSENKLKTDDFYIDNLEVNNFQTNNMNIETLQLIKPEDPNTYGIMSYDADKDKFNFNKGILFYNYPDQDIGIYVDDFILTLEGFSNYGFTDIIKLYPKAGATNQNGVVIDYNTNAYSIKNILEGRLDSVPKFWFNKTGLYVNGTINDGWTGSFNATKSTNGATCTVYVSGGIINKSTTC